MLVVFLMTAPIAGHFRVEGGLVVEKRISEVLPSQEGEVSALASAGAPFIYFDGHLTSGVRNGIANITLVTTRFTAAGGEVAQDLVITAHLRTTMAGLADLKRAIEAIELLATPPASEEAN